MNFTVKKASLEEKTTLFAMVHTIWPHHNNKIEHTRLRLESIQHRKANWYVGLIDNEVATGLGVYKTTIQLEQETRKLAMIGAVYTDVGFRKQGLAAKLITEVIETIQAQGYELFMLYSDIDPAYYEKLGFQAKRMELATVYARNHGLKLKERPLDHYHQLTVDYPFMITRDRDYTNWLFKRSSPKLFVDESGKLYVLAGEHEGEMFVLESSQDPSTLSMIEQLAADLGESSLKYWGTMPGIKTEAFDKEIPMFLSNKLDVKPIIENIKLFPIDHV